jgi:hypothetical protein
MDLQEVEWGYIDWIALAQGRDMWWVLVNVVMNLWLPYSVGRHRMAVCRFEKQSLHVFERSEEKP